MVIPQDSEWICQYISKKDKQVGIQGKVFAEVMDIGTRQFDSKNRVIVSLKVMVSFEPGQYPLIFGRYPLRIGQEIAFQPENYVLIGNIIKVDELKNVEQ
jgi:hypothetical protein